ncbi:MAG: hypothetical protein WKF77_16055 [Planctomycetaceae bacterium]
MRNPELQSSAAEHFCSSDSNDLLVILFIPTKDNNGKELPDSDMWLHGAITVLSKQFGGATVMAPADGAWYNPDTKEVIREKVHLVHSYGKADPELNWVRSAERALTAGKLRGLSRA